MVVEDPGEKYQYLSVHSEEGDFKVWKHCRVEIYDAFWATEPTSEDEKPRVILFPSQVPEELWKILKEQERLDSAFAEISFLKQKNDRLDFKCKANLFAALAILGPFALLFFVK
jgi:hypothetical protein